MYNLEPHNREVVGEICRCVPGHFFTVTVFVQELQLARQWFLTSDVPRHSDIFHSVTYVALDRSI